MKIAHASINDQAYTAIRKAILDGDLSSGDRLSIESLSRELGVSTTPIRDALKRLELEGLVIIVARSGTYVTLPTPADVEEVFDVRIVLEKHAVELAVGKMAPEAGQAVERSIALAAKKKTEKAFMESDRLLHAEIIKASGNRRLAQLMDIIHRQTELFRVVCAPTIDMNMKLVDEHRAILEAIQEGSAREASKLLEEHLRDVQRSYVRILTERESAARKRNPAP